MKQCWYHYDAVTRTIWVWTNLLIRKENFSNLNVLKNHARLEVIISQVVCSFLAFLSSAVIAPKSAQFWVSRFDLCCIAWWLPCLVKKRLCLKKKLDTCGIWSNWNYHAAILYQTPPLILSGNKEVKTRRRRCDNCNTFIFNPKLAKIA